METQSFATVCVGIRPRGFVAARELAGDDGAAELALGEFADGAGIRLIQEGVQVVRLSPAGALRRVSSGKADGVSDGESYP